MLSLVCQFLGDMLSSLDAIKIKSYKFSVENSNEIQKGSKSWQSVKCVAKSR
jgi:hypothetical protein